MLLKMDKINKSFAGVQVLKDVDFNLRNGEVHALMGENGAGKSTLMKILNGIYAKDEGAVYVNDELVNFNNTSDAQEKGITIVHQELNMMKDLTVAQNIFLGKEIYKRGKFIDDRAMVKESKKLFEKLHVDIDPSQRVGKLSIGEQQMVEIAKAIAVEAKIIVFDEPTAALSLKEIDALFQIIKHLTDEGIGVIYISHRMDEIEKITDRITVLRDGTYIGTVDTKETSQDDLIKMMVGRTLSNERRPESTSIKDEIVLKVEGLTNKYVSNINFELRKGEILGFSGLMGSGRTEVARAIFGADSIDTGKIIINGNEVKIKNTTDALKYGIGYISEDRRRNGVHIHESISKNISINNLDKFEKTLGVLDDKAISTQAEVYRDMLNIKLHDVEQEVINLSGGNQQKVVIAKWLAKDSEIIIFDEPTRGIDVGAKVEIYDLMDRLVLEGKSIIMISSEMEEVLRMSDRILVMCEGSLVHELSIDEATQEEIMRYAVPREGVKDERHKEN